MKGKKQCVKFIIVYETWDCCFVWGRHPLKRRQNNSKLTKCYVQIVIIQEDDNVIQVYKSSILSILISDLFIPVCLMGDVLLQ